MMHQLFSQLLHMQSADEATQRRGRMAIMTSLGVGILALLFAGVVLFVGAPLRVEWAAAGGVAASSAALVLARRGFVNHGALLLVSALVALPLAAMLLAQDVTVAPFLLVLSVVIASLVLRPWHVWLVLYADLLGLGLMVLLLPGTVLEEAIARAALLSSILQLVTIALFSFLGAQLTEASFLSSQRARRNAEANATALLQSNLFLEAEIIERQRIEDELMHARDLAEQANRTKNVFLANMSHELRTPLSAIIGYSELIQIEAKVYGYAAVVADVQRIKKAGDHLLTIINDLLDLSKIEAGKMELNPGEFSVLALVEDVTTTVQPLVAQHGNTLTVVCAPDVDTLYADQSRVQQILFNLLSNAAKFTERGTITLRITCDTPDARANTVAQICFEVEDTGIGIAQEQVQTIFDPFTQAAPNVERLYGGTGLGLTICRHLCEMMGGSISISSEQGRGSTFAVSLPLQQRVALPIPT